MNDIEILEDLLKQKFDRQLLENISMINEKDEVFLLTIFERQAIENLIKENKELKKQIPGSDNYIPKSKVEEKIEKYIKADCDMRYDKYDIQTILFELLED